MFPPTRCLPGLRYLRLYTNFGQVEQLLSQADIQAMVSCCTGLVDLWLGPKVPISTAAPLQQLTGLTALRLCTSVQDSVPSIARLTELQHLMVDSHGQADRVTVCGLLQLTVLQQLKSLQIKGAACDPGLAPLVDDPSCNRPCLAARDKVGMSAAALGYLGPLVSSTQHCC